MEGILTGVGVGVAMLVINAIVRAINKNARQAREEVRITHENQTKIAELEQRAAETKELVKLTLSTCIILGDGMVQNGINGEFRKAFCEKKQDALKLL